METLGYSHIATAGESSTVEPTFESVDWKRFSSLGMMGLISAVTILGSLSTTADSAAAYSAAAAAAADTTAADAAVAAAANCCYCSNCCCS